MADDLEVEEVVRVCEAQSSNEVGKYRYKFSGLKEIYPYCINNYFISMNKIILWIKFILSLIITN